MTKKLSTFLCLLIILLPLFTNGCQHDEDQANRPFKIFPRSLTEHPSDRMLASTAPIRISAFYHLDNVLNDRIKTAISNQIMPAAIAYYQSALKVVRLTQEISMRNSETQFCAGVNVQSALYDGVDADLVLLVTAVRDTSADYVASASTCFIATDNYRPIVGHVKYNIAYGFTDDTTYNFEGQLYATLHELGHALGFSAGLYDFYINPNTNAKLSDTSDVVISKNVNGISQNVLTVEPLRTKLRTYFGCNTLEGAYIEQQGGSGSAGSHFERRIFMNEMMTSSTNTDTKLTEFYLALLESTGWYTPDYTMAEPIFWGKGLGCNFLDTKCIDSNKATAFPTHYCTTLDVDRCSFSGEAYAVCGTNYIYKSPSLPSAWNYFGDNTAVIDIFADNCPYYYAYHNAVCRDSSNTDINLPGGEYFGQDSNCFTGTLGTGTTTPYCLKNTCTLVSAGVYNVIVTVGSTSVTCTAAGTVSVTGYSGTLTCPDPNTYCATTGAVYCPRGCMGKGTCSSGVCTCNSGYSGVDCAYTGTISFTQVQDKYVSSPSDIYTPEEKSDKKKVIIIAVVASVVGVGALLAISYIVVRMRRAKMRRMAARNQVSPANQNGYPVSQSNHYNGGFAMHQQPQMNQQQPYAPYGNLPRR